MNIKVGIIVDWERSSRKCMWDAVLKDIAEDHYLDLKLTHYPMADLIVRKISADGKEQIPAIQENQVLIVNWDAINGDPDFGAHLALRWFEHRQPELLLWVKKGNILIVESQAVLGVPCATSYDAIAGRGELMVSGKWDTQNPMEFRERIGSVCEKTKRCPSDNGFELVDNRVETNESSPLSSAEMFPNGALKLLTNEIRGLQWNKILYRGWFRRVPPMQANLPWVSILRTTDRSSWKKQSVMKVAKIGKGAIFATTMCLAATKQTRLIHALLDCRAGNTAHLPEPAPYWQKLERYSRSILTVSSGAVAGLLVGAFTDVGEAIASSHLPIDYPMSKDVLTSLIESSFIPVGMLSFSLVAKIVMTAWRHVLEFVGY